MHILFVFRSHYPEIKGGVDTQLVNLIGELGHEYKVTLFVPSPWQVNRWQQEEVGNVTLLRKRLRLPWDVNQPWRGWLAAAWEIPQTLASLYVYCRKYGVDVVHIFTLQRYHFYFRLLAKLGGPPYVVTGVGSDFLKFPLHKPELAGQLRKILEDATALTAVAPQVADGLAEKLPMLAKPTVVMNGLSAAYLPTPIPPHPPLPHPYFVMVGDIDSNKSPHVVVQAWQLLKNRIPHLHLMLVAMEPVDQPDVDYYGELLATIRQEGLGERVHFLFGLERATTVAVMKNSMGVIMASRSEGMPYTLLECGLLKRPAILSRIRPFTDLLVDERDALLFAVGDAAALADRVEQIAQNPELAQALSQNLHAIVSNRLSARQMAKGYVEVYQRVVNR
ncbi:MAG: glycosyltransferase family 4 protein [Magnetococcales bacterium]|nr:glycosyltransferase family 4 protein [Magnetococcales bacterium]NGZ28622.1 glycosyltransferase family 4 protein [Magnetococcales bacterium]